MKKLTIAIITVFAILVSCKKDSDDKPTGSSRTLRYEVTGNYTGKFIAAYHTTSGGLTNEEVTSLPWSKEITYQSNVAAASIGVGGAGGVAGQKVTLVIKRGGIQEGAPIEQTVNSQGAFSIQGQVIVF